MARDPFRNNRALESIAKKLEDGEKETITKLNPALIDEHPDNEYLFGMPEEGIESLKKAMLQKDGTVVCDAPILVWDTGNGRYLAYSGHLRKRAFTEAGGTEIPAIIREIPDEPTQRRMLLGANIYGRNVNPVNAKDPIHTARQIQYMKVTLMMEGFTGGMREQLAKEFHTSGSTIQRYESLFKLPENVQEKVQSGELPDTVAQAMGNMKEEQIARTVEALEQLKGEADGTYFTRDNALKVVSEAKKEGNVDNVVKDILQENIQIDSALKPEPSGAEPVNPDFDSGAPKIKRQITFSNQEEFNDNVLDVLHIAEARRTEGGEEADRLKYENLMILDNALKVVEAVLTSNREYPDNSEVKSKLEYLAALTEKEIERVGKAV